MEVEILINRKKLSEEVGSECKNNYYWIQIVGVTTRDAGVYQCQAATSTGTITLSTHLSVLSPQVPCSITFTSALSTQLCVLSTNVP